MKGRASAAIVVLAGVASAVAAGAPPVVLAASGLPLTEFNCYNPFQAYRALGFRTGWKA